MAAGRMEFHAHTIMQHTNFSFVLPTDSIIEEIKNPAYYDRPAKALILLHGLTGTDTDWLYGGVAHEVSKQYNLAIFMPTVGNSFYLDRGYAGGKLFEVASGSSGDRAAPPARRRALLPRTGAASCGNPRSPVPPGAARAARSSPRALTRTGRRSRSGRGRAGSIRGAEAMRDDARRRCGPACGLARHGGVTPPRRLRPCVAAPPLMESKS